jgi:hypothetical protein
VTTAYILVAIQLEERDPSMHIQYREYRRGAVLVPVPASAARTRSTPSARVTRLCARERRQRK